MEVQKADGLDADSTSALGPDLLVDESFLLSILRAALGFAQASIAAQSDGEAGTLEEQSSAVSEQLQTLWDLSVDESTAVFIARHKAMTVLSALFSKAMQNELHRCAEVSLGCMANLCVHTKVAENIASEELGELADSILVGLTSSNGPVAVQAARGARVLLSNSTLAGMVMQLRSQEAFTRYLFILENSLLWEAVQQSCDTLSQLLVLEMSPKDAPLDERTEGGVAKPPAIERCVQERLLGVLAERIKEASMAQDIGDSKLDAADDQGDTEKALLSALCLADTLLTVLANNSAESIVQGADGKEVAVASLHSLVSSSQPEVHAAALEVVSSVLAVAEEHANDGPLSLASKVAEFANHNLSVLDEHIRFLIQEGTEPREELLSEAALSCAHRLMQPQEPISRSRSRSPRL